MYVYDIQHLVQPVLDSRIDLAKVCSHWDGGFSEAVLHNWYHQKPVLGLLHPLSAAVRKTDPLFAWMENHASVKWSMGQKSTDYSCNKQEHNALMIHICNTYGTSLQSSPLHNHTLQKFWLLHAILQQTDCTGSIAFLLLSDLVRRSRSLSNCTV